MNTDIVLPKDNESEFIIMASKLGYRKLYFLYPPEGHIKEETEEKLAQTAATHGINLTSGIIANQKNQNNPARHSKIVAARSTDSDRFLIESKKVNLIYGLEGSSKRDYFNQRSSGLNHVICEIARKNNVTIGLSYGQLFGKNKHLQSILLGRMMQNISLCRKYHVKTAIGSFSSNPYELRSPYDVAGLFSVLGMDSKDIKESMNFRL